MKHSLRTRLLIGVVIAVFVLLTIFSAAVYIVIRGALVREFDDSLISIAQVLAASVEADEDRIELEFDVQQMPEFQDRNRPTYWQLWRLDGTTAAKSSLVGKRDLPHLAGSTSKPAFKTIKGDGRVERVVCFSFMPRLANGDHKSAERQPLILAVARDSTVMFNQLRLLGWVLFVASVTVTVLSVVVAAFTVRQGLWPLTAIACEIAAIKEHDLAARIGAEDVPSELLPIRNRLNDLLSRLEAAFKKERRFTADVAHELRTPLAGIRSTIEVTLARNRSTVEYQAALSECLIIVQHMQTMVNNLLMLARLDACQITFRYSRIQLAELVTGCWQLFADRALQHKILFENRVPGDLTVSSDRESLSMVFSNLLDNASEYAQESGRVWVTACRSGDSVEIGVANTGCRLSAAETAQVFDAFWRGNSARSQTGIHCGLGLALVQRIVRALGGTCAASIEKGGVFTVTLCLPRTVREIID